jgi:hypothetical protein
VNPTHHRSTAVRWAALAAKVVAGAAAGALIVLVALVAYAVNDVGDPFSPVRMSGPVGDSSLREEYEYSHLVTAAQIATIHPRMPGNDALRILGGRSQQIPVTTRIKHRWLRTGTCYDYPIAGTGHLYDGPRSQTKPSSASHTPATAAPNARSSSPASREPHGARSASGSPACLPPCPP